MALNTWVVSILWYGAGILKWNKVELQEWTEGQGNF